MFLHTLPAKTGSSPHMPIKGMSLCLREGLHCNSLCHPLCPIAFNYKRFMNIHTHNSHSVFITFPHVDKFFRLVFHFLLYQWNREMTPNGHLVLSDWKINTGHIIISVFGLSSVLQGSHSCIQQSAREKRADCECFDVQ